MHTYINIFKAVILTYCPDASVSVGIGCGVAYTEQFYVIFFQVAKHYCESAGVITVRPHIGFKYYRALFFTQGSVWRHTGKFFFSDRFYGVGYCPCNQSAYNKSKDGREQIFIRNQIVNPVSEHCVEHKSRSNTEQRKTEIF